MTIMMDGNDDDDDDENYACMHTQVVINIQAHTLTYQNPRYKLKPMVGTR